MNTLSASKAHETVRLQALRFMLRPFVRFCLRGAHSLQEVIDQLKVVFVDIAAEELERGGLKRNPNRISLMTGVHRRDVTEILEKGDEFCEFGVSPISKILGAWEQDPKFSFRGKPRILTFDQGQHSFTDLVHSVSRHLHPRSVLAELLRTETVSKDGDKIKLDFTINHVGLDPTKRFRFLGRNVETLIDAAEQNYRGATSPAHLQVRTEYDNIVPSKMPEIRKWLLEEGKAFHKRARDFISQYDIDLHSDASDTKDGGGRVILTSFSLTEDNSNEEVQSET